MNRPRWAKEGNSKSDPTRLAKPRKQEGLLNAGLGRNRVLKNASGHSLKFRQFTLLKCFLPTLLTPGLGCVISFKKNSFPLLSFLQSLTSHNGRLDAASELKLAKAGQFIDARLEPFSVMLEGHRRKISFQRITKGKGPSLF